MQKDQEMATRALRKIRIHGPSSPQLSGCQEFCMVRATRSGCGIMIVTRPSSLARPHIPSGFAVVVDVAQRDPRALLCLSIRKDRLTLSMRGRDWHV